MKPRWKEIEAEYPWLETKYFEFDEAADMVQKYGITDTLPTFVFLDKGEKEIMRLQGEVSKAEIVTLINKYKDQ